VGIGGQASIIPFRSDGALPRALQQVGTVERSGTDVNHDLVGLGLRIGHIGPD
jgi:hypothetical protein